MNMDQNEAKSRQHWDRCLWDIGIKEADNNVGDTCCHKVFTMLFEFSIVLQVILLGM